MSFVDVVLLFFVVFFPAVVAPVLAGSLLVSVRERIRRGLESGLSLSDVVLGEANPIVRYCMLVVAKLMKRGLSLDWACRIVASIVTLLLSFLSIFLGSTLLLMFKIL